MNEELDTLKAVRELINTRDKWTQQVYARNKTGTSVDERSLEVTCFCLVGALRRIVNPYTNNYTLKLYNDVYRILSTNAKKYSLTDFNDRATYEEVISLLDSTIQGVSDGTISV